MCLNSDLDPSHGKTISYKTRPLRVNCRCDVIPRVHALCEFLSKFHVAGLN